MSKTALLFPGQGSHTPDMRDVVADVRPDLLEALIGAVGEDPFPRAEEATRFAQPAIFCASLAHWCAKGKPEAELLAGHSLGELAALVVAGSLAERDALELVVLRGALMQESGEQAGAGGMLAVMGQGAAERAGELAEAHAVAIANDNSPQQIVLSGPKDALADAAAAAEQLGLRAMTLPVTGAFHSEMMRAAEPRFKEALERVTVEQPRATVLSVVTAAPFDDVRLRLAQALTMPVRWRETMLALQDLGASRFHEIGPGRVLSGLAKRTVRDVELVRG